MSKTYFCKYLNDLLECGETDPSKFEKGRYTICRECRKKYSTENRRLNTEKKKVQEDLDPDKKIQKVVENVIKYETILEGKTMMDLIDQSFKVASTISENVHIYENKRELINNNFQKLGKSVKDLYEENTQLRFRVKYLEDKMDSILDQIKVLNNRTAPDYIKMLQENDF